MAKRRGNIAKYAHILVIFRACFFFGCLLLTIEMHQGNEAPRRLQRHSITHRMWQCTNEAYNILCHTLQYIRMHFDSFTVTASTYNAHWKALIISLVIVEYILFTIWKFDTKERTAFVQQNALYGIPYGCKSRICHCIHAQSQHCAHTIVESEQIFFLPVFWLHVRLSDAWVILLSCICSKRYVAFFFFNWQLCVCLNISFSLCMVIYGNGSVERRRCRSFIAFMPSLCYLIQSNKFPGIFSPEHPNSIIITFSQPKTFARFCHLARPFPFNRLPWTNVCIPRQCQFKCIAIEMQANSAKSCVRPQN